MVKKGKKPEINKEDFIKILTSLGKNDIQCIIQNKGKGPKLISPVTLVK